MLGSPALRPDEEPRPEDVRFFWAFQNYQKETTWKQSLTGCPDVSIPIFFYIGTGFELNVTCSEYFKSVDSCFEVKCNANASCISKGNSFECNCNEGYTSINDSTNSSGEFSKRYAQNKASTNLKSLRS